MKKHDPLDNLKKTIQTPQHNIDLKQSYLHKHIMIDKDIFSKIESLSYFNKTTKRDIINKLLKTAIAKIEKEQGTIPSKPTDNKFII